MAYCPTEEKYGYEDSRFEKAVDAHFHCSICYNVLKEPMMCRNNEHVFCRDCITEHLTVNSHTCPECNEDLTVETLRKARLVSNYLSELKIKCDYSNRGCQEFVRLEELDSHVENCGFAPATCSNEECQMVVNKREIIHHESTVCEYRKVKCHNCVKIEQDVEEMKEKMEKEVGAMKEQVVMQTKKIDAIEGEVDQVKEIVVQMLDKLTVLERTVRMVSSNKVSDTIREDITIVAGFDRHHKVKNSVERFSWKNNVWVKIASLNIARMHVTSFLFGDELYVVGGGASGAMEALNLNDAPGKWTLLAAELPACYEGHRTLVYQNRLILIGGSEMPSIISVDLISEILLTPPYTSKVLCRMPHPRKYFGAELFEDRILIFGGRTDDGDYKSSFNSVLEFDLNTNECRNLSQLPCAISGFETVRWGDKVVLIGGLDNTGKPLNQVLMYDSTTGKIDVLPSMLEARVSACAVITGNMIVVMGGAILECRGLASVEGFVLGGYSWEYLPSLNEGRSRAAAALVPAKFNKSWP